MRGLVIAALALAGIASPAVAADPGADKAKEDKIICKRVQEESTGSHFPVTRKTCLKRSEWRELAQGVDRAMRDLGDARSDPNNPPAGMGGTPQ